MWKPDKCPGVVQSRHCSRLLSGAGIAHLDSATKMSPSLASPAPTGTGLASVIRAFHDVRVMEASNRLSAIKGWMGSRA